MKDDLISKQVAINGLYGLSLGETDPVRLYYRMNDYLKKIPERVVRCKDCKHFKRDYFSNVCGVPIITCHNICTKWNGRDGGCVTREDGYCFLGERRENVIAKIEPNNCTRYICPECGKTLLISDGTAPVDLPKVCGHCGKDVYFMGNDEDGSEK